ncbi:hypothetical protein FUAX_00480 [Fulvitalea axinellae]|uniref:DUF5000 domain-containing protein n=1 Tax=Fulvitalea axinellae TaxID=1182444 RepID=A0AAU9D478_9BACT|nr:hypothetical protein FUAX_00480 [Fulvitalea axinellae]
MKKIKIYACAVTAVLTTLGACKDVNELHEDYLKDGEEIYIGKPLEIRSVPGKDRLKLVWLNSADPKIKKAQILWGDKSKEVEVAKVGNGEETMEVTIDGLEEKAYVFKVIQKDNTGNESVPAEVTGRVYGQKYIDGLNNSYVELVGTDSAVLLNWSHAKTSILSEVTYMTADGTEKTRTVPSEEEQTVLKDAKFGTDMSLTTMYRPEEESIDDFYADSEALALPKDFGLNRNKFGVSPLATDEPGGKWGGHITNLWNGNKGGDFFYPVGGAIPFHFTIDLGGVTELTRANIIPRKHGSYHNDNTRVLQIWGIAELGGAETTLPSTDEGWEAESAEKGWVLLKTVEMGPEETDGANVAARHKDKAVEFDDDLPAVRYIRIRPMESWGKVSNGTLSEIELFADKVTYPEPVIIK